MKAYGEVNVQIHVSLTSVLVGGEWSASRPGNCIGESRETTVGIATDYGLHDQEVGVRVPVRSSNFIFPYHPDWF
jgi:hypothetical protein